MSSIDISSTNDITTTGSNSFCHATLTADTIIRECIKQGFYRNPVCNEKLYLHNKGFDNIDTSAFDRYTDVKVLWLEGNGFSSFQCGSPYIQVAPPTATDPFENATSRKAEADSVAAGRQGHADPSSDMAEGSGPMCSTSAPQEHSLPDGTSVPPEKKDIFSSLYPTVRQLYLHNNVLREMPDLSRFQRLDGVNMSNNFIRLVAPHCSYWDASMRSQKARRSEQCAHIIPTDKNIDGTAASELSQETQQGCDEGTEDGVWEFCENAGAEPAQDESPSITSPEEALVQRERMLTSFRRSAMTLSSICPHTPVDVEDFGKPAVSIPRNKLNPCSSLRTLNLSGNRLARFEDVIGLLCYKALSVLDLSQNQIADGEALLLILELLPQLKSLKLSGNPLVRSLPRYRKTVLARCTMLTYLDDRPVFDEERRLVTAWAAGGDVAEADERKRIQDEKEIVHQRRLDEFRALISQHRNGSHKEYIDSITAPSSEGNAVLNSGRSNTTVGEADSSPTSTETSSDDTEERADKDAVEKVGSQSVLNERDGDLPVTPQTDIHDSVNVVNCTCDNKRRAPSSAPVAHGPQGENALDASDDIYIPL